MKGQGNKGTQEASKWQDGVGTDHPDGGGSAPGAAPAAPGTPPSTHRSSRSGSAPSSSLRSSLADTLFSDMNHSHTRTFTDDDFRFLNMGNSKKKKNYSILRVRVQASSLKAAPHIPQSHIPARTHARTDTPIHPHKLNTQTHTDTHKHTQTHVNTHKRTQKHTQTRVRIVGQIVNPAEK